MANFYRLSSAQENVDKDRRCCELLEKKSKRKFDLFKTDPVRAITSAHSKSSSNQLVRFSGINMIHINDNISPNDYLTSVLILLAKSTKYRFKHKVRRATLRVITWKTNDNHGAGRHNIRLIYFFLFFFAFILRWHRVCVWCIFPVHDIRSGLVGQRWNADRYRSRTPQHRGPMPERRRSQKWYVCVS